MFVYGGTQDGEADAALYKYDVPTGEWTAIKRPYAGTPPGRRINHRMAAFNDSLIIAGGNIGATYYKDAFMVTPERPADCETVAYLSKYLQNEASYGKKFCIHVIASATGLVVGDNPYYSMQSYLPAVALHAGLAAPGEDVIFDVTIQSRQMSFKAMERNGIVSGAHIGDQWTFMVQARGLCPSAPEDDMDANFGFYGVDQSFLYEVNASDSSSPVIGGSQYIPIVAARVGDDDAYSNFTSNDTITNLWDGNFETTWELNRENTTNLYVEFQLQYAVEVTSVQLWWKDGRVKDLYFDNTSDVQVLVGDVVSENNVTVQDEYLTYSFPPTTASKLKVLVPGGCKLGNCTGFLPRTLALAEVRIFGPPVPVLKQTKSATLSGGEDASGCSNNYDSDSCISCPGVGCASPWLKIDLGHSQRVVYVSITAISGLGAYEIYVGDATGYISNAKCASGSYSARQKLSVTCGGEGRYVYLVLPGSTRTLHIQDMTAYGYDALNFRTYAAESKLSAVAVHAGVLRSGERGYVLMVNRGVNAQFRSWDSQGISSESQHTASLSYSLLSVAPDVCSPASYSSGLNEPFSGHAMGIYDEALYVWGGNSATGTLRSNGIDKLDLKTWVWTALATSGTPASPRSDFSFAMWKYHLVIYGGTNVVSLTDINMVSVASGAWVSGLCTSCSIGARVQAPAAVIDNHYIQFDSASTSLAVYDLISLTWTDVTGSQVGTPALPSYATATTYTSNGAPGGCPASSKIITFGGESSNMTWALTIPQLDYHFTNVSIAVDEGLYVGRIRDMHITMQTDTCGNGLPSGGKLSVTVPAGFEFGTLTAQISGHNGFSNSFSIASKDIYVNGQELVIDTGANLLLDGGFDNSTGTWTVDSTGLNVQWEQAMADFPSPPLTSSPAASKFGGAWGYPVTTDATNPAIVYQLVDMSGHVGQTLYLTGFVAGISADVTKATASVTFYSTSCSATSPTVLGSETVFQSPSTGAGWMLVKGSLVVPTGAGCARVRLSGKQNTYFDHFFFGTYPNMEISLGTAIQVRIQGIQAPRTCEGMAGWVFNVKTFQYYTGDELGTDSGESDLDMEEKCINPCQSCQYLYTIGEDRMYRCSYSSLSGRMINFERKNVEDSAPYSDCRHCSHFGSSPYSAQCLGSPAPFHA